MANETTRRGFLAKTATCTVASLLAAKHSPAQIALPSGSDSAEHEEKSIMFVSPVSGSASPQKRAWDNLVVYDNGFFYAFFATGYDKGDGKPVHTNTLDVARSSDGVHWEFIARDQCPVEGAHAGYGVKKIREHFYYYPTCSNQWDNNTVHFKIFRTRNFLEWEYLGKQYDVHRGGRYYAKRWEEMMVLDDIDQDGRPVFYGYISSENNPAFPPSAGMLKSYDGIHWEILPPVRIEWGETPAQHGELNFVFKLNGRYYFSNTFRGYMDTFGFGAYVFVGDSPFGPFKPDLEMFRLCGNSRRDVTWFTHQTPMPDGSILAALWLSHDKSPEIPSSSFAIGPLKKYITQNGHLRLAYWEGTEAAKGSEVTDRTVTMVHPKDLANRPKDTLNIHADGFEITADRNGVIVLLQRDFDREKGFIIEGFLTARESRGFIETHHHAASAGFYFEHVRGDGAAILPETLGVTRCGRLRYAEQRLTDRDVYEHIGLVKARSGNTDGTLAFDYEDTVGPFGHASFCGIRHARKLSFKLLAKGDYYELYIDGLYVQTHLLPERRPNAGRMKAGFCVIDGACRFEALRIYEMSF
jgi:hypothetical protein